MDAAKRKKLEAAGWVVADHPAELLNLTDEERKIVDLSVSLSIAIRDRRTAMGMTQAQLTEVVARIRFQLFTGSRPKDACTLRGNEIDRSGDEQQMIPKSVDWF